MLATCAGCYLLWWGVAFYPERHAPLWLSGILLVATAVCGIMAVNWMSQGIFQTEGIRKGVSGGWIMAGGVICYVVLLVISNLVFHRMVTTELFLIVGCLIVVSTWTSVGYYMIICLAGLTSIPDSVLEAGELDGATGWKKIWNLYIPMLWEPLKMSTIMVITGVLKIFDTVYILTPTGGTSNCTIVPALLMYNEAYRYGHYGTGSAIATVIFVLSAAVSIFSLKLMNQKESIEY